MRHAWTTVAVVVMASFQVAMTLSVVFIVFVDLGDYFPDASNAQLSWAINAFTIVSASTVVIGAAVADRFGRRRVALIGTAVFAAGSVVAAAAPGIGVLIGGRCVQALGAAMFGPASLTLVLEAMPFEKRGVAIGVFTMGGALAAASGPALGGVIVEHLGWRWAFVAATPIGLLSLVAGLAVYRESFGSEQRELPDPVGALLVMMGVGSLVLALVQTDEWGWSDPRTATALVVGLLIVTVLLRRSLHHPRPIIDLGLYRHSTFRAGNVGIALFATSFFTMQFGAILFLTEVWAYGIDRAGLLASPFFLATGLVGPIAGRFVDRHGPRPVAITGALIWSASIAALAMVIGEDPRVGAWLLVIVVGGIGSGLVWGSAPTLAMEGLDGPRFAKASGMNQTLQNTGNAFAIAVAITLLGDDPALADFRTVFALVVGAGLATVAVVWTARGRAVVLLDRA